MIDKADLLLYEYIAIETVRKNAAQIDLEMKPVKLKNNKWGYQVGPKEISIRFETTRLDHGYSRFVYTNPSKLPPFSNYESVMKALIGRNQYECAQLMRLDLNRDFEQPFLDVIRRARVRFKQVGTSHNFQSSKLTGVTFGKKPEEIAFYDKAHEQGIEDRDWTRIEVRMWRPKIPVDYVKDLPLIIGETDDGDLFCPFAFIEYDNFEVRSHHDFQRRSDIVKAVRLDTLVTHLGRNLAQKILNKDGKFNSKYGKYVIKSPSGIDLDREFRDDLTRFFAPVEAQ